MGKVAKSVTKAVTKTVKKAADMGKNFVQSVGKAAETAVSGTAKLATGDVSGALDKYGRTAINLANVSTGGSLDLSGRNNGVINMNTPEYYNTAASLIKGTKSSGNTTTETDTETDGLLQYVSDLRTRKARRSRASTNNTSGGSTSDSNKLSGTTALGV